MNNTLRHITSTPAKVAGMSMVELLVAMVLGLGLVAGVLEVYTGNEETERYREASQRIQENGRFALNYLSDEIGSAGHLGCQSSSPEDNINNALDGPAAHFQPELGLQGWEASGTDAGDIFNSLDAVATVVSTNGSWASTGGSVMPALQVVPGSDIVRTWNGSGEIGQVIAVTAGTPPAINISNIDIEAGDVLMLNDCEHIDLVQACSISNGAGGTLDVTLSTSCSPGNLATTVVTVNPGAEVTKLEGSVIYVGKRNNAAANPPSLMRARLDGNASPTVVEELIPGVESLQVLYGVNTDHDNRNTADAYVPADQVPAAEWGRVISARISLLVQSEADNVLPESQGYQFNGVTYDSQGPNGSLPQDRRLRRVFNSTISLRNRTLGL